MDWLTTTLIWGLCAVVAAILTWAGYRFLNRHRTRLEAQRMTRALSISHAVFTALEHVPNSLINRDLRRGLVLLLTHHIEVMQAANPQHPHLYDLQARISRLNRMPSGLASTKLRNKVERRHASVALEEIAKVLKEASKARELDPRAGALAHASAVFSGQQIAVETARQAAKDAENIRAYPQALNFALQAQALCKRLPPLIGQTLREAVDSDIERLETLSGTARI